MHETPFSFCIILGENRILDPFFWVGIGVADSDSLKAKGFGGIGEAAVSEIRPR